jgi:hypothetical protein
MYQYYYYCCDNNNDIGYGCTYRCIQTLISAIKYYHNEQQTIPSLQEMLLFFKKNIHNITQKSELWIEPHQAKIFIESYIHNTTRYSFKETLYTPNPESIQNILKTPIEIYTFENNMIYTKNNINNFKQEMIYHFQKSKLPIITDNGTYTYIISNCEYNNNILEISIIDPHKIQPNTQIFKRNWNDMFTNTMWMILYMEIIF